MQLNDAIPLTTLDSELLIRLGTATLLGLILGLVARSQSKKAGFGNGPATAAIVISIVSILFWIGAGITLLVIAGDRYDDLAAQCDRLGPGIQIIDGQEVPCT